jgi:hypothetical protein
MNSSSGASSSAYQRSLGSSAEVLGEGLDLLFCRAQLLAPPTGFTIGRKRGIEPVKGLLPSNTVFVDGVLGSIGGPRASEMM